MSFINYPNPTPLFPELAVQGWSFHKIPSFTSTSTKATTGREVQLIRSVYPRWEFTISYSGDSWLREQTQNITPYAPLAGKVELEQVSGLFVQCLGDYGEFYFNDPADNSRTGSLTGFMPVNSVATIPLFFQWGDGPYNPPMMLPVQGIASIDKVVVGPSILTSGRYSVDATNTQIVIDATGLPGGNVVVDFHFYYRCRFLASFDEYEEWAANLWQNKELKFQSVKP